MIEFHPHAGGLVSVSGDKTVDIYSLGNTSPAISLEAKDASKSHVWSPSSGAMLLSHSTTNILSFYDPRASPTPQSEIQTNFQTTRPSHSAFLDDTTVIATGISPARMRNMYLYDLRSPLTPKSTIPFDPASSPSISLFPLVDSTRKLLYLLQSHSSSLFAFDFSTSLTSVPTTLQIPSTIAGGALLPPRNVDVMRGEINRVFVLTRKDEIVPVSVRIERKVFVHEMATADRRATWTFMKTYFLMSLFRRRQLRRTSGLEEART